MRGVYLTFFVTERGKHRGDLTYEWLLSQARELGLHGGTAVRATAGFGRHGRLHEETFFELAPELPVEVSFAVTEEEAEKLLGAVRAAGLKLFYTRSPVEFGVTGEDGSPDMA
jgi:PII-like signaling protein